jgi:4-amino-4-deoxy-L-arabinose transferase-like glycosyltransferase
MVVLAALLRLPTLGRAYWVDEGISVGIASHHLSQIPGLLRHDGSPPFFYVLLHFWLRAFGATQVSTHVMSLSISLAVVPVAWWCGRRLFGRRVALWAALLAATSPFLNWYATETRMYPLVCGLATVAVTCSIAAVLYDSRLDFAGAVVAFVALLYTHNWSMYLFAVTVAVLLAWAGVRRDRRQAKWVGAGAVLVLAAYAPWVPSLLFQVRHTGAPWAIPPSLGDFFSDPSSVLGGTLGFLVVPLFAAGAAVTWIHRPSRANRTTALLATIGLATLLSGWLIAQVKPTWTSRYLAVALGPLLLALAGALGGSWLGRRIIAVGVAMLVTWSVVGSLLPDSNARDAKSNVAAIAAAARPELNPGDVVVVTQSEQVAVLAHYLPAGLRYVTPTGPVADPRVVDWRDLVQRLQRSNPCRTVAPAIAALPPGAHILVVNPYRHLGASGTTWARTVNAQVAAVNELVLRDPGVSELQSYMEATEPKPYSAVDAALFVRTASPAACS